MAKGDHVRKIEQTDTGTVFASVYSTVTGRRVGFKFFDGYLFESQEHKLKRAHKWADKWIANCDKYCVHQDTKPRFDHD